MDILTQGLLGGVLAQSVATKKETKLATAVGVFAGLIADADIFIYSSSDPLLNIEFHRHFTHSLFFIPFGALIAMAILWPFLHKKLSNRRLYLYSFLGYSMSGFLDACTSYGTHLLWPLYDERIAFNIISIIDPVFTLTLFVALVYSLTTKAKHIAQVGLVISFSYMLLGVVQHHRAQSVADELAKSRGHIAIQHVVKPTMANNLLWRSVYITDSHIYVDAIRLGLFSKDKIYSGDSAEKFIVTEHLSAQELKSVLNEDIKRFTRFSSGYVAIDKTQPDVIGDLRYSMLPTSVKPLWGIVINKEKLDEHAEYKFFRDNSPHIREQFINMLLARDAK
ncbi:MAG: metal-dependent hydrolase [Gammaproteobacteria bacterium]|nr:metal-dependent hydrolase [Gammaproteobacteria bacterium]MCW8987390.1 metal-dependent hydrolase [Gammaproteobacteria bacterium]MCW9030261.1 metal-dependent hydrolase [Gammaproteobacteria bacterium]